MLIRLKSGSDSPLCSVTTAAPKRRSERTIGGKPARFTRIYVGKHLDFHGMPVDGAVQCWTDSKGEPMPGPPIQKRIVSRPGQPDIEEDVGPTDSVPTVGPTMPLTIGTPRQWEDFRFVCRKILDIRPASMESFDGLLAIATRLGGLWAPCLATGGATVRVCQGGRPYFAVSTAHLVPGRGFVAQLLLCDMALPHE